MCTILTPIPSKCDSKVLWDKALVKESTRLFVLSIFATATSPRAIMSQMMWYFFSICFPFLWFLGLCNRSTIVVEQCDRNLLYSHNTKIKKEFLEPNRFLCCFKAATYSASMVESATQDCLTILQTYGSTSQGEHTIWSGLSEIKIWLKIRICVTNRYQNSHR